MILPEGPDSSKNNTNLTAENAINIAKAGINDIGDFCTRNPDACLQGKDAITNIGDKTIRTARSIYDYLQADSKNNPQNKLERIIIQNDIISIEEQISSANSTGQTLTLSDLNIDFLSQAAQ